jgi:hypothetical protein
VRPARFERATLWFVAKYSIQLSYGRFEAQNYNTNLAEREGFDKNPL